MCRNKPSTILFCNDVNECLFLCRRCVQIVGAPARLQARIIAFSVCRSRATCRSAPSIPVHIVVLFAQFKATRQAQTRRYTVLKNRFLLTEAARYVVCVDNSCILTSMEGTISVFDRNLTVAQMFNKVPIISLVQTSQKWTGWFQLTPHPYFLHECKSEGKGFP